MNTAETCVSIKDVEASVLTMHEHKTYFPIRRDGTEVPLALFGDQLMISSYCLPGRFTRPLGCRRVVSEHDPNDKRKFASSRT